MELDNLEKRNRLFSSDRQIRIHRKRPVFAFFGEFVLAEELGGGARQLRKAEPTVQLRQTDKNSPEKAGFAFFGEFILAEGLGNGAGQHRKVESTGQTRAGR
ncbi:hypothetical protein LIT25_22895 [Bacillus sp. F19]|nr:hypothetical protein LIT25_22895 [Bacillus sp. F19]